MNKAQELINLCEAEDSDALVGFQKIVRDRSMGNVDGVPVDLTTANFVLQIYKALSPEQQAKFKTLSAEKMIALTMKMISKAK